MLVSISQRFFQFAAILLYFTSGDLLLAQDNNSSLASGRLAQGATDRRALNAPARNAIFSCDRQAMGAALNRPWVDSTGIIDLAKKPNIEGSVTWESQLNISPREPSLDVTGNGLPNHPTGNFPVARDSAAYQYDRNPNAVQAYRLQFNIPNVPQIAEQPGCLPMGTIGIALSGAVFFNALDAPGRDAVVHEIFDRCEGHPERNGRYHYHHDSPCFDDGDRNRHSPLIGYALDGFAIYGPRDDGGTYIANDRLDECHGHIGPASGPKGEATNAYHYHANREFPYTLGCFRGVVSLPSQRRGARPRAASELANTEVRLAHHDAGQALDNFTDASPRHLRQYAATAQRPVARERPPIDDASTKIELKVVTVGTGGPPNNSARAGPSALIQYGDVRFLVDMGRDTQSRLQQANIPLRTLTALMFTHHHLDHNEEFVPILLKARLQGGAGQIIGPPGTKEYTDFIFRFYRDDSDYRAQKTGRSGDVLRNVAIREVSSGDMFTLAGVTVKTARVNHTIHTVAYRFDAAGKSIVVSGDLSYSQSLIELARGADVLVIDSGQLGLGAQRGQAAVANQHGEFKAAPVDAVRPHGTLVDIANMAQQSDVKKLVLTHFANPSFDEGSVRSRIAEIYKGNVIFAGDLLEILP